MKNSVEKYVKTLCVLVALLLLSLEGKAAEHYVTNSGNAATNTANLLNAVNSAVRGDVIYINGGTYLVPDKSYWLQSGGTRDATYSIKSGVTVIGGYDGGQTIITGNTNPSANNAATHLFTLLSGTDTTRISGITFQNTNPSTNQPSGTLSRGGAIYTAGAKAVISNCSFTASANDAGGAIYAGNGSYLRIEGSMFADCIVASSNGGAMMLEGATLDMMDCELMNNTSNASGGAIYATGGSVLNISNTKLHDNGKPVNYPANNRQKKTNHGGAFYLDNSTLVATNCNIYDNAVSGTGKGGAGFLANNSSATLNFCTITGNSSTGGGAGFSLDNTPNTLNLNYCTLAGNANTGGSGGGVIESGGGNNDSINSNGSVITGNENNTQNQGGNDVPDGTNMENTIHDTTIVVSTDTTKCNPCVIEGINPDSVVQIGDSGQVVIVVPPEIVIVDENGDTTTFEITDPTDTTTGPIIKPKPKALVYLIVSDSLVCTGDAVIFSLHLSEAVGENALFKLYRIENGEKTLLFSTESEDVSVSFVVVPRERLYDRYIGEVYYGGSQEELVGESNPKIVVVMPKIIPQNIGHSKNVVSD